MVYGSLPKDRESLETGDFRLSKYANSREISMKSRRRRPRTPLTIKNAIVFSLISITTIIWKVRTLSKSISKEMLQFDSPMSPSPKTSLTAKNYRVEKQPRQLNQILYTGSFGIGHRINKLSCVFHLLSNTDHNQFYKYISKMKVEWGSCPNSSIDNITHDGTNIDIFQYLFASQYIHMSDVLLYNRINRKEAFYVDHLYSGNNTATIDYNLDPAFYGGKTLWIRNDVAGYYAGQSYKNTKIPINKNLLDSFQHKLESDYYLFQYFINDRFIGRNHVQQFKQNHDWDNHFVIGIHIRAGNGEQQHFVQSGRNTIMSDTNNDNRIIEHIAASIHQLYRKVKSEQSTSTKPPLVFVATDTEFYIAALTNATQAYNIPVISFNDQPRIPIGKGVSYDNTIYSHQQTNISCYQSWYGSMMDMILLSESHTLITTTRSTFTQILPNNIIFNRADTTNSMYKYCEMDLLFDSYETKVTCFVNQASWLLRNNSSEWYTFCINSSNHSKVACGTVTIGDNTNNDPVTHKLMVHLPDIGKHNDRTSNTNRKMYTDAMKFLQKRPVAQQQLPNKESLLYYYGKKFNGKYRVRNNKSNEIQHELIQNTWTWES